MALEFWFVTYTLQRSIILRGKKKKNIGQPDSSRIYFANSWGQIQSHGGQRKFPDGFPKKDLCYQWLYMSRLALPCKQ